MERHAGHAADLSAGVAPDGAVEVKVIV